MSNRTRIGDTLNITETKIDLHKSFGIYRIINKVTRKFYIGMTTSSFMGRWTTHANDMNRNAGNTELTKDWKIYGKDNFVFEVVEVVYDKNLIFDVEKYWIKKFFGEVYNEQHNRSI